jgi:hypothetical protein
MRRSMTKLTRLALAGGLVLETAVALAAPTRTRTISVGGGTTCVCTEHVRPDSVVAHYRAGIDLRPPWCARDADSAFVLLKSVRRTTWYGESSSPSQVGEIVDTTITDTIQWIGGVGR